MGRLQLSQQNLVEFGQLSRIRQNSIKALDLFECDILYQVFYRDILTVTRLVPLHYLRYLNIIIIINLTAKVAGVLTKGLPFLSGRIVLKYHRHSIFALSLRV